MAKILLVEDDNNLREIYEARLQAEGYTIVSANDGESALVIAKGEKPDLIISDVMMPKISGFEMLDILRNTDGMKDVKVIMLTALGQADDQARANQLGADRYLVKSQVTLEDIVKVSHELLEGAAAPAVAAPTADAPAADVPSPAPAEPVASEPAQTIPVTSAPSEPTGEPAAGSTTETPVAETSAPAVPEPATSEPIPSEQEGSEVAKQIEDFVANQPATPPTTVEPTPTEEAPSTPEVTTPETTPGEQSSPDEAASQVLTDTASTLLSDNQADQAPAASEPAEPAAAPDNSAPVGSKRVIQPLDSTPKPDLDALLAAEEAKETAGTTLTPEIVVGGEAPAGAPAPPPSSQAETVHDKEEGVDPNSIAL